MEKNKNGTMVGYREEIRPDNFPEMLYTLYYHYSDDSISKGIPLIKVCHDTLNMLSIMVDTNDYEQQNFMGNVIEIWGKSKLGIDFYQNQYSDEEYRFYTNEIVDNPIDGKEMRALAAATYIVGGVVINPCGTICYYEGSLSKEDLSSFPYATSKDPRCYSSELDWKQIG